MEADIETIKDCECVCAAGGNVFSELESSARTTQRSSCRNTKGHYSIDSQRTKTSLVYQLDETKLCRASQIEKHHIEYLPQIFSSGGHQGESVTKSTEWNRCNVQVLYLRRI